MYDTDSEEEHWYAKYEDPHMHAALRSHDDYSDAWFGERRPEDHDFYTFDWHTIHGAPLRETHIRPMSEHSPHHSEQPEHHTEQPKKQADQPAKTSKKPKATPAAAKPSAPAKPSKAKDETKKTEKKNEYYYER